MRPSDIQSSDMRPSDMHPSLPLVRLRAMEVEDLDCLYLMENDETVWSASPTSVPYSRQVLLDYIVSSHCDIYMDRQVRLMAENDGGEVIGIVDLVNFDPCHGRAEVGIVIKNGCRHVGYGRAAMLKVIDYAKNVIQLHQIYAIVAQNNESCLKMLKDVGFQLSMTLREWLKIQGKYEDAYFFQYFL